MNHKMRISLFLFFLLVIFASSCREEEPGNQVSPTAMPSTTPLILEEVTATPPPLSLIANADPAQPRVIGQHPVAGEEVSLDGVFEIYFDQPMRPDTAVTVTDEEGDPVDGQTAWPQPRILRFTPAKMLQSGSRYQMKLETDLRSADGVPLLEGLTLDFHTIGELAVSQIAPADGTQNVAIDTGVTVIFNRPVVPLVVGEDAERLPNPLSIEPEIPGQGEWVNTSVYVYRPDEPLIGSQTYRVRVQAEVINSVSATGAQMAEDATTTFTVAPPTFDFLELVESKYGLPQYAPGPGVSPAF